MALQGTLETFSVPEVLRLLSSTKKTGLLALDGDRGLGNVWFEDGDIVGARSDQEEHSAIEAVLFDLLRYRDGSFVFDSEAEPIGTGPAVPVETALGQAEAMLTEWQELAQVVPSLHVRVRLVRELAGESATVTSDQWRSVVAVAGGATAAELGRRLGLGELDTCRRVRDLVTAALVEVDEAAAADDDGWYDEGSFDQTSFDDGRYEDRSIDEPTLVDHDLSSDEVATLGSTLVNFVAKGVEDEDDEIVESDQFDSERFDSELRVPEDEDRGVGLLDDDWYDADADPVAHESAGTEDRDGFPADSDGDPDGDPEEFLAQLSNLSPKAAAAVEATAADDERGSGVEDVADPAAAPATSDEDGDEEINRNLLLKFLSSTKN